MSSVVLQIPLNHIVAYTTFTNSGYAVDNIDTTYADTANVGSLTANGVGTLPAGTISKVRIGIRGYHGGANYQYIKAYFNGTLGTRHDTSMGNSDTGTIEWFDVTSDGAGPGADNWTWNIISTLGVYGEFSATSKSHFLINQLYVEVTYEPIIKPNFFPFF